MWALGAWMLLGALGKGSAQLLFNATRSVEPSICNKTVILPCIVNNLALKKTEKMFVKWKLEKKYFFSFDGSSGKSHSNESFSSAALAFVDSLPQGIASLRLTKAQALPGNYSCEVTESNREGETIIELTYLQESWFTSLENILIIFFLVLAIVSYWIHLGITVSKFETTFWKKIWLFIGGGVITLLALIGFILLVPGGFGPKNQAGLGLIVLPSVILVPLQYLLLKIVSGSNLPRYAIFLVVMESVGYVIALTGFALCVTACPPKNGAIVIVGLAIIAFVEVTGLSFGIVDTTKKGHQPSTDNWRE